MLISFAYEGRFQALALAQVALSSQARTACLFTQERR